jgi:hypothetical protein
MILSKSSLVTFISFVAGFVSVQRFFLAEIYHVIPLVFILLAIIFLILKNKSLFAIFSLISLLSGVDNGGDIYNETPSLIRYSSYALCLLAFFYNKKRLSKNGLVLYIGWLSLVLMLTLHNYENVVLGAVVHNVIMFSLVFLVFVFKSKDRRMSLYLHAVIFPLTLGIIFGELINLHLVFDITKGYLSYNSIKSIIVYPCLYAVCKRKFFLSLILIPFTIQILVFYVTRMIILSFLIVLLIIVLFYIVKRFYRSLLIGFSLVVSIIFSANFIQVEEDKLAAYKVTAMLLVFTSDSTGDFSSVLRALDPVRHGEMMVIGEASIFNIFFGNGFGASFFDNKNIFDFVGKDDTAFSENELASRRFYNFHDIWSDVGYRIGLAPLALLFFWLTYKYYKLSEKRDESFMPLFCIVLVFCAFFSTAGMIFIFIMLESVYTKKIPRTVEYANAKV